MTIFPLNCNQVFSSVVGVVSHQSSLYLHPGMCKADVPNVPFLNLLPLPSK